MNAPAQPAGTAVATTQARLIPRFAERYGVDADKLLVTLKNTAFRQDDNREITNEVMMSLLVVADQYKLNPFTREIFAFFDKKKGIIPVVSVDGWSRIINSHGEYAGIEFRYSDTFATPQHGKPCPEWCEALIYHKGRERPTVIREYLDEVYVGQRSGYNGPWQTHTKRMLRHKTLIQGARVAFGFSGIYDEDEAHRIVEVSVVDSVGTGGGTNTDALQEQLAARAARNAEPVDAEFTDAAPAAAEAEPAAAAEDGGEPDPIEIERLIAVATDGQIMAICDRINLVVDPQVRKDLTRKALARKASLMTGEA